MTQVTRAEYELIEFVRGGAQADEFKLSISQRGGVWTIDVDQAPHDDHSKARGSGSTFGEAWNGLSTLAIETLTSPPLPRQ